MNQERGAGDNITTTEVKADMQEQASQAKRRFLTKWDIMGIVLGMPIFVAGLCFAYGVLHGNLYQGFVGAVLLFISTGLFIPSRLYEQERTRAIRLVALSLAIAVLVDCAFLVGFALLASPNDESLLSLLAAAICLVAFVHVLLCTLVLLRRLRPMRNRLVISAAVGAAVGALNVLSMYLLHVLE